MFKTLPRHASFPPGLPVRHLPRPHLVDGLLDKPQRLRLLCAPAGFGKSLLCCEVLRRVPHARVAWIAFGGRGMALETFCQRLASRLGLESRADRLLDSLARCEDELWLVLDDYPVQDAAELDHWLGLLLHQAGPGLQLLVSCRQRPRWNLARLRLEDQLLELDSRQLAFSRDEFSQVMDLLAPQRDATADQTLWQQSRGWCAATRLLGEPARDPGHAWLREYLEQEVLARLPACQADILRALAHLPRIDAGLFAHLWPHGSFDELLKGNGFHALDGGGRWHALLPMIAAALAGGVADAALTQLRLQASAWLAEAGFLDEAIELALQSGAVEQAARLMERLGFDWLFAGAHLRQWLAWHERLPDSLLLASPRLIFQSTRALLLSWRLDEAQRCLDRLERFVPLCEPRLQRRLLANWQALHGALAALGSQPQVAREHCQQALVALGEEDWRSALLCCSTLGRVALGAGDSSEARRLLQEAVEIARRHGCLASEVLVNTDRIRLAILSDELTHGEILLHQSLELIRHEPPSCLMLGRLHLLRGELLHLRGATNEAVEAYHAGLAQAREGADPFILHGYIGLSGIAAGRGEIEQAGRHLQDAERRMHCNRAQASCYQLLLDAQHLRLLARRQHWQCLAPLAQAIEVRLAAHGAPLHAPALALRNQLSLALAERGLGDVGAARKRLRRLLDTCRQRGFNALANEAGQALGEIDEEATASGLSNRERSVLSLLAEGLTNQEIGDNLYISLNTVKAHTKSINAKLGVRRRTLAVVRAREMGLLAP